MNARRTRVLHVITKLDVGGAQETAIALCAGLDPGRFDVELVAGPDRGTGGDSWSLARRRGVSTIEVRSLRRRVDPVFDTAATLALFRLFRRHRPDIVHTHSSKAGVVGRVAAWLARVPVRVHTVHGWSFREHQAGIVQRAFVAVERVLARVTTALVVVSRADETTGLALAIGAPSLYHVIRSGIDVRGFDGGHESRLDARARLGIAPDRAPVIGSVTRFGEPKDPATTVRAFRRLRASFPAAQLVLVGDGPERSTLEELARSSGVADACTFAGVRNDVPRLLPAFDVFILTSRSEGLPRAVAEAMAAGVPVVASAVGGVPELVIDGTTGLLVRPGDDADAAAAVARILDDAPLRDAIVSGGLAAVAEFDDESMVAATARLYQALFTR